MKYSRPHLEVNTVGSAAISVCHFSCRERKGVCRSFVGKRDLFYISFENNRGSPGSSQLEGLNIPIRATILSVTKWLTDILCNQLMITDANCIGEKLKKHIFQYQYTDRKPKSLKFPCPVRALKTLILRQYGYDKFRHKLCSHTLAAGLL